MSRVIETWVIGRFISFHEMCRSWLNWTENHRSVQFSSFHLTNERKMWLQTHTHTQKENRNETMLYIQPPQLKQDLLISVKWIKFNRQKTSNNHNRRCEMNFIVVFLHKHSTMRGDSMLKWAKVVWIRGNRLCALRECIERLRLNQHNKSGNEMNWKTVILMYVEMRNRQLKLCVR